MALVFLVIFPSAFASPLLQALQAIPFRNSGTTTSTDTFFYDVITPVGPGQTAIYLEADNVSCLACVWSDQGVYYAPHPYLFMTPPGPPPPPPTFVTLPSLDWTQAPVLTNGAADVQSTLAGCTAQCASLPACVVGLWLNGTVRHGECWLAGSRAVTPRADFCGAAPGQDCAAFACVRAPGFTTRTDPPSGLRSAVPLGGISAGSFELRGDGSLHEWIIHNAGPQGAAKVQSYPEALFAVSVNGLVTALQTHPLVALPGVAALQYAGTHPVSRLNTTVGGLAAQLFAFSALAANNMSASARPAAAFVLALDNPAAEAAHVTFAFNLPLRVESDQLRAGTPIAGFSSRVVANATTCLGLCDAQRLCLSWVFRAADQTCTLQSDAPLNMYTAGITSGLAGYWMVDSASQCLVLVRPGVGPMHGNVSVCADGPAVSFTTSVGPDAVVVVQQVAAGGAVEAVADPQAFGAVGVTVVLPPQQQLTLTLTVGWTFPHRDHFSYNYKAPQPSPFNNQYAVLYPGGAVEAAWGHVAPGTPRMQALTAVLADIAAVHAPFFNSSLPVWLQDLLVNSLSHTRNSMWFQACPNCHRSADARVNASTWGLWRQWEAYDCPDMDSIHNDGERSQPYLHLFPDGTRSKLAAWSGNQQADGMLAEQILNVNPDQPQGRIMSDSTSMFIGYVLDLYRLNGDVVTLNLYYPTVKKAAAWHLAQAAEFGVPVGLETTYDILGFTRYQLSTYASVFHLFAMRASAVLATAVGDIEFASACNTAFLRAQVAIDTLQWNATLGFYNGCTAAVGCSEGVGVFADAFYAQVLAYSVGLGDLLQDPSKLDRHLDFVWNANCVHNDPKTDALTSGCPNGLVIMTGRPVELTDLQVWEMATYDHVALLLWRGGTPAAAALDMAMGTGTSYSSRINDQWNIAGIKSNDGYPSITSHYGYHMTSWHIPLALSGQVADLSNATQASLAFSPRLACGTATSPGFVLPVLLPGVLGTITCGAGPLPTLTLALTVGSLALKHLAVGTHAHPAGAITVAVGVPVTWVASN